MWRVLLQQGQFDSVMEVAEVQMYEKCHTGAVGLSPQQRVYTAAGTDIVGGTQSVGK